MPAASPMRTSSAVKGSFITPEPQFPSRVSAGMKTILAATGLALVLLVPTGAIAKPDKSERDAAKAQCTNERGKSKATRAAFRAKYDGFADCVGKKAAEQEAAETKKAAKQCAAERAAGEAAFKEEYGTNKNGRNAFGKCVSRKVRGGS